jgi:CMP/dCMP kinase
VFIARPTYREDDESVATDLNLRELLADLADSNCEFVVIGSSALAIQGWEVSPTDLDLIASGAEVESIAKRLGVDDRDVRWVQDGEARRLECITDRGPVDLYTEVSGGLTYDRVAADAVVIVMSGADRGVKVGSLDHVRDMRAAVGRNAVPESATPPASKKGTPRVIAIDGPAGAGKSTVTRAVAKQLGFTYLDTGAMYRSVTLEVLDRRADTDDPKAIAEIANGIDLRFEGDRVYVGDRDVTEAIRSSEVTYATAHIAAYPEVRSAMVARQRQLFNEGGFVAEGRDTGTVVAPDAPLKIYLTASPEERAKRRSLETGEAIEVVLAAIQERDRLDSARRLSALTVADDAVVVDTTGRPIQAVVDEITELARERGIA